MKILDERSLAKVVIALLEEMNSPHTIVDDVVKDFDDIGVEYCVLGGVALGRHNFKRYTEDIDFLISAKTYPLIKKFLIGKGYTYKLGSKKNMYVHTRSTKMEIDILVEGDTEGGFILPSPLNIRDKVSGIWYINLPKLIEFKIEASKTQGRKEKDIPDIIQLIRSNNLNKLFAKKLAPKYREEFLKILEG